MIFFWINSRYDIDHESGSVFAASASVLVVQQHVGIGSRLGSNGDGLETPNGGEEYNNSTEANHHSTLSRGHTVFNTEQTSPHTL